MDLTETQVARLREGVFNVQARDVPLWRSYYQTEHWRTVRRRVLFSRPLCERCQKRRAKHLHHLTYKRIGRELSGDVQAVCETCHFSLHGRRF